MIFCTRKYHAINNFAEIVDGNVKIICAIILSDTQILKRANKNRAQLLWIWNELLCIIRIFLINNSALNVNGNVKMTLRISFAMVVKRAQKINSLISLIAALHASWLSQIKWTFTVFWKDKEEDVWRILGTYVNLSFTSILTFQKVWKEEYMYIL